MYEKDGEKYFVFDSHLHFWDASPDELGQGPRGVRQGLDRVLPRLPGPRARPRRTGRSSTSRSTRSTTSRRTSSRTATSTRPCFQSTYLKEWYTNGFNDIEQNAALLDRFPGKLIVNGRWDPREGEAGLEQLEADHAKYGLQGVKLYTAEWYKGSRGWKLTDPEAVPVPRQVRRARDQEHPRPQGPDDLAAGQGRLRRLRRRPRGDRLQRQLNFIVEHVGLPRIEDFCFMATQEPNVYAGLAVVIGGLMHARPQFFAKVMGELLFWVGEDKMLFGSDYAIWEPKWQVEGLVDWEMPDERRVLATTRGWTTDGKKKILGLNAAKLYGVEVPAGAPAARPRTAPRAARRRAAVEGASVSLEASVLAALGTVYDPELDEPITALGFVGSCVVSDGRGRRRPPAPAHAAVRAELRLPDGRRRPGGGAVGCRRCAGVSDRARGPLHGRRDQRGAGARRRVRRRRSRARPTGVAGRAARAVPAQGAARPPGAGVPGACSSDGADAGGDRGAARRRPRAGRRTPRALRGAARRARAAARPRRRRRSWRATAAR